MQHGGVQTLISILTVKIRERETLLWGKLLYGSFPSGGKATVKQVFRGFTMGGKLIYNTGILLFAVMILFTLKKMNSRSEKNLTN